MEDHKVYDILNQNDQLRNLKFRKPALPGTQPTISMSTIDCLDTKMLRQTLAFNNKIFLLFEDVKI